MYIRHRYCDIINEPKLSIVVLCYNIVDFVKEALASALNFSNQNTIEIIMVNEGSNKNKVLLLDYIFSKRKL